MRGGRRLLAVTGSLALVLGLAACEPVQPRRWDLGLASVNAAGTDGGNGSSGDFSLSADGTKVVFQSGATDLVPNDSDPGADIYVRDLATGATSLVSHNATGTAGANDWSGYPKISPDGTRVAFLSSATDLGPSDTDEAIDLYVRDLVTGDVALASTDLSCSQGDAFEPLVFSPDGGRIAFAVENGQGGQGDIQDAYVRDLAAGTTSLAAPRPTATGCAEAGKEVLVREFSPDGSLLGFTSMAGDLVPVDTNDDFDAFVRDLVNETTRLVSTNASGTDSGNNQSFFGSFSPDGSRIVLNSQANDLGPVDSGFTDDVYLKDLVTGETTLVSVNAAGTDSGTGISYAGAGGFDATGSKLLFVSSAENLTSAPPNGSSNVYIRDLSTGVTTLVTRHLRSNSHEASNPLGFMANGTKVLVLSEANDFGPRDSTRDVDLGNRDLYLFDLQTGQASLVTINADGTDSADGGVWSSAARSSDGTTLAFLTKASNLGPPDAGSDFDVYIAGYRGDADLSVGLTASPEPVDAGGQLTYTMTVANGGPDPATATTAALSLPDGVTFAASPDCSASTPGQPHLVTCSLGDVGSGDAATVTVTASVTAPVGSTVKAIAAVTSLAADPSTGDNLAAVDSTVG